MSYLLEVLGRGLLAELAAAFRDLLSDDGQLETKDLEHNVESDPCSLEWQRQLAVRMLTSRRFSRARAAFSAALKLDPNLGDAYWLRARIRIHAGTVRDALTDLERALGDV